MKSAPKRALKSAPKSELKRGLTTGLLQICLALILLALMATGSVLAQSEAERLPSIIDPGMAYGPATAEAAWQAEADARGATNPYGQGAGGAQYYGPEAYGPQAYGAQAPGGAQGFGPPQPGAPNFVPGPPPVPARTAAWAMGTDQVVQPVVPDNSAAATVAAPQGKPGILQEISVSETWLPRGESGFGINDLTTQAVFGFPLPTRESPLLLTPAYGVHYLDGPSVNDLPAHLHDASIEIRHMRKLTPTLGLDLAIAPGWHGDFQSGSGKTFRLPARVVTALDWTPQTQLVAGVAYFDRENFNILPVGGVIWKPDCETRVEAIFPRPRVARRFACCGTMEDWMYVAGEVGGGSYGVRRDSGTADVATLTDLRLICGVERKNPGSLSAFYEFGYVFAREIEYESTTPSFEPDDTVMVRGGLWY